jgi:eukaryotic-like serine/threonine-protein kinase
VVAPSEPEMFGAYRLVSRLARGGMAETWLAERVGARGVTKRLIIKRVLPNLSDNEKFVNSFISEARLSTTLSHGNIA